MVYGILTIFVLGVDVEYISGRRNSTTFFISQTCFEGTCILLDDCGWPYLNQQVNPVDTRRFLRGLKGLFEGLIFGWAYLGREICLGLALKLKVNLPFCFVLLCIWGQFSKYKSRWGLYLEGRFKGGFFALPVWAAYIWRGLYMEGFIFGILRYLDM